MGVLQQPMGSVADILWVVNYKVMQRGGILYLWIQPISISDAIELYLLSIVKC